MLFSALLLCAAPAQLPAAGSKDLFAMTQGGVQIEVAEPPEKGARVVITPFGRYWTPRDPVQLVFERVRDRSWVKAMRANPQDSLVDLARQLRDNGQISALLELADAAWRRGRVGEIRVAFRGLESWGAQLDPIPADLKLEGDARVKWLWEHVQKERSVRTLLLGGRLVQEVIPGRYGVGERQLRLTEINHGLEDDNSLARRAAAAVAGAQIMTDDYLGANLLNLSLYGPPSLRDRAADSAQQTHPEAARDYWTRALLRAEDLLRFRAAEALAFTLPKYAPKAIGHALSANGKRAPKRYQYADHKMQVVVDRREPMPLLRLHNTMLQNDFYTSEYLESASTIKVVKLSPELQQELIKLLAELADDGRERTMQEWLDWAAKAWKTTT